MTRLLQWQYMYIVGYPKSPGMEPSRAPVVGAARVATPDELADTAAVLGLAFSRDPVLGYLVGSEPAGPSNRSAELAAWFASKARLESPGVDTADLEALRTSGTANPGQLGLPSKLVMVVTAELGRGSQAPVAAAIWEPPTTMLAAAPDAAALAFSTGLGRAVLAAISGGAEAAALRAQAIRPAMAGRPADPHWYLSFIGTRPEWRGVGAASRLLAAVTELCDAGGQLAYLESSNPANVPLYQRHGFKVRVMTRALSLRLLKNW